MSIPVSRESDTSSSYMFCFVFSFSLLLNLNINAIMRLNWLISIYASDQAEINDLILSTDH